MSHLYVSEFQYTWHNIWRHILLNIVWKLFHTRKNSGNYFSITNNIGTIKLIFQT